jgi:outer membrane lipoprotein-sorting protein
MHVILVLVGCLLAGFLIGGCASKKVMINNYAPALSKEFAALKGQKICFLYFQNHAQDATRHYFYSKDKQTGYTSGQPLFDYFRHAFEDASAKAGMIVTNEDKPDLTAPAMWVTLLSVTDERFETKVWVQKKDVTVFTKPYTVEEPSPPAKDAGLDELSQRAYRMTNRLIESVLGDPEFQKVITSP